MRATPILWKGFWARSADELKRLSNIALSMEGIKGPQGPYILHTFHDPDSIQACKLISDAEIGGFSHGALSWTPFEPTDLSSASPHEADAPPASHSQQHPPTSPRGYARFHGNISTELPRDRPEVQRSGYAAWRTADRGPTVFGRPVWDIDSYAYLALRLRSDGRSYMVNVQTESVVPTDLHQHRLFAKRPGQWETVLIRWNDFVRTNHGRVVEPQAELLRQKVRSVGVGLTDRVPGPFELCIESVWATNHPEETAEELLATSGAGQSRGGNLRNRHGDRVAWSEKTER